ncbi:hypothetical protein [Arthrobacter sp. Soil762]|uniref:hypothetical protein n=1 Tax=Arthrobacter sp. Soil762 TaxID=1736401 RepID=UPI000700D5FC|nr:hypothetical protein [Arthrobacter sp. Soil762]KRE70227.1 hypothetical protein ASG77_15475 [Arthrobacter sp. Soil762]
MTSNASSLIRTIDEMLLDAGVDDPAGLRETLLAVGSLGSLPAPAPGPELAALMSGQTPELARHRLLRKHRTTVVGLAVIAGMGLGVTGVAATGTAPDAQASSSIQKLLQDWAPGWSIAGTPAASGTAANPAEAQLPGEPTNGDDAAPAQPQTVERETAPPANGPESAGQNRGAEPAGRGNGKWVGNATGKSKEDDGGAPGNAAGVTRDAAAELDKAGKPAAGTLAEAAVAGESLTSAIVSPALTEKTGAGKAGPGSIWRKKFTR